MPKLLTIAPPAPPAEAIKPTWEERTIIFKPTNLGGRVIAVDGWVYGSLCIHSTWAELYTVGGGPKFALPPVTITHRPTKLAVAYLDVVDEAVAQVEWLWDLCPQLWTADEQSVIKSQAPAEAREWSLAHSSVEAFKKAVR